jgi:hypothetical protein
MQAESRRRVRHCEIVPLEGRLVFGEANQSAAGLYFTTLT